MKPYLHMKCFFIGLHQIQIWWERFEGNRRCSYFYIRSSENVIYLIFVTDFDSEISPTCGV